MFLRSLLFFLFSFIGFQLFGQEIEEFPSLDQDSLKQPTVLDSGYIHKIYLNEFNKEEDLTTFAVPLDFRQYDPARQTDSLFAHGGSPASAAFGLFKTALILNSYDLGIHQYDLYKSDQKYYFEQSLPYSHLYFSPGQTQDHISLQAKFSRSFENIYGISFDYRNLNDIGWYTNQLAKLNGLNASFWYRPKNKRYSGHFRYNSQTNAQQHNGGVSDHNLYNVPGYELRTLIPIYLKGATTRFQERKFDLDLYYQLIQTNNKSILRPFLHFESELENLFFKFFDEDIENELNFYGEKYSEFTGLRHFIQRRKFKNSISLNIDWSDKIQFSAGLSHNFHLIHQEPKDFNVNDLYAVGKLNLVLFNQSNLQVDAQLGALDALGEYAVHANLTSDFKSLGILEAELISQNKRPSLLANSLYVNQKLVRNNSFENTNETRLSFKYHLKRIGLTAVYAQQYIYRAIYFDKSNSALQYKEAYLLTQFQIHENFKLKWFHFDNTLVYQIQNAKLYPIPDLYSVHSMYVRRFLFKSVMDFKGGVDLRYIFDYKPAAFDPLTANFYLQDDFDAKAYPALDVFVEGKVSSFALFVKVENTLSPLLQDQFFMLKDQPQFDLKLRLGFVWQLWN